MPVEVPDIATTCDAIERFMSALRERAVDGISLYDANLEPQSIGDITKLETELAVTLPADVTTFLQRGLRSATGSYDKDGAFAGIGFEFQSIDSIIEHTQMLRKIASENPDEEQSQIILNGVALTYEEPELVLAGDGSIHHWSFRNPKLEVAPSFRDFLAHWAASGCHSSHAWTDVWPHVQDLAPLGIAPAQNLWLRAYQQQFPDFVTF